MNNETEVMENQTLSANHRSSHTRHGKIARLPRNIRDELNQRLDDGEEGNSLLDWLNGLPVTQKLVKKHFKGVPISKQNLSEWRQGGFLEWQRRQEAAAMMQDLMEGEEECAELAPNRNLGELVSRRMTLEFLRTATELLAQAPDPQARWACLEKLLPQLNAIRRGDHRDRRLKIVEERWEAEQEEKEAQAEEAAEEEWKSSCLAQLRAPFWRGALVQSFGGGPNGEAMADLYEAIQFGTNPPKENPNLVQEHAEWLRQQEAAKKSKRKPRQSNLVKPGQSQSNEDKVMAGELMVDSLEEKDNGGQGQSKSVKPGQSENGEVLREETESTEEGEE